MTDEEDPVVAEVRRWRAELMKEAGGTIAGLMDLVYGKDWRTKAAARTAAKSNQKRRRRTSHRR